MKKKEYLRPECQKILVIVGAIFLLFTLSGSRRGYYLFPILPFTSMFIAMFFDKIADLQGAWRKTCAALWYIVGAVACLPFIVVLTGKPLLTKLIEQLIVEEKAAQSILEIVFSHKFIVLFMLTALIGVGMVMTVAKIKFRCIWIFPAFCYCFLMTYFGFIGPNFERLRGLRNFGSEVRRLVAQGDGRIVAIDPGTTLLFYLNLSEYKEVQTPEQAQQAMSEGLDYFLFCGDLPQTKWLKIAEEKKIQIKKRRHRPTWGLYIVKPD